MGERREHTHLFIDLDGTISESEPGIAASLREAFATIGLGDPGDAALRDLIGPPFEIGLARLGLSPEQVAAVVSVYRSRYEATGLFETNVYEGVREMLDELARLDIILAVATAKPEASALRIVDHFGLTDRFATIAGATYELHGANSRRTKADVIAAVLGRLDLDADVARRGALMLGDRDHDVEGALAHGIGCLGAGWGYGSDAELRDAGVLAVFATPADVIAWLTEST